ncbi:hypothetical protein ASC97_30920 [Rhizobium sp. Root1203]|nr:hypothetical protein ASC97_30920 [Rhizobium sp. Root1203]
MFIFNCADNECPFQKALDYPKILTPTFFPLPLIFQIAEERFFNDGAEFSRAFRRAFGQSPSEVRNHRRLGMPIRHEADCDCPPEARLGILLSRLRG